MSWLTRTAVLLCLWAAAGSGQAGPASPSSEGAQDEGVPISRLVAVVAKKTGKKFVLDPRVHANVILVGQDPSDVTYSDLLTILQIHGFFCFEDGGYVKIVPDANARQSPVPTITPKDSRPGAEMVSALIALKSISATALIPIFRPLVPQYGHLAAFPCTNTILIVDSFSNIRRIEAMIRALDTREPLPLPDCGPQKQPPSSN